MTINQYEQIYQTLKHQGAPAWTDKGYARAWENLCITLARIQDSGILPAPGAISLELGCGNGAMASLWLSRHGYQVYGVDISPTAIGWATESFRAQGLEGHFNVADISAPVALLSQHFDLIYDGSCLHCLTGEQRTHCFENIRHALKPEGMLIISSMCGEPKRDKDRLNYDAERFQLNMDGQPWRTLLPLDLLQEEITAQGFVIAQTQVHENPWWDHATLCCYLRT